MMTKSSSTNSIKSILKMDDIKFIKLINGDDIVTRISKYDNQIIEIIQPLLVKITKTKEGNVIIFYPWFPLDVVDDNRTFMRLDKILCVANPKLNIISKYNTAINKLVDIQERLEIEDALSEIDDDTIVH